MRNRALLLFCLGFLGWAPPPAEAQDESPPPAPKDAPLRDPTLRDAPGPSTPPDASGRAAERGAPAAQLPTIALKALVVVKGRAPAAIVDVGGALHHVTAGSRVTHVGPAGDALALEVTQVSAEGLTIAVPSAGCSLVVR